MWRKSLLAIWCNSQKKKKSCPVRKETPKLRRLPSAGSGCVAPSALDASGRKYRSTAPVAADLSLCDPAQPIRAPRSGRLEPCYYFLPYENRLLHQSRPDGNCNRACCDCRQRVHQAGRNCEGESVSI